MTDTAAVTFERRSQTRLRTPLPWHGAGVLLLTACDRGYLPHALALARSIDAVAPGSHLLIHVINPDEAVLERIAVTKTQLKHTHLYVSTEKVRLPSGAHKAAYYASARFLRMSEILNLRTDTPVLALDADALAVAPVDLDFTDKPEAEVCLRRRPDEVGDTQHLHVAAGAVWARSTPRSRAFFDAVSADLLEAFASNTGDWFIDQKVLGHHVQAGTADARVRNLKSKYADWLLRDDAVFWMGKGERKFLDVRYLALRDSYDEDENVREVGALVLRRCRARMGPLQADSIVDRAFAASERAIQPRVAIFLPRLDLPWKAAGLGANGRPPMPSTETVELRLWWKRFTMSLSHALTVTGATVDLHEIPAWEITPERVDACGAQLAFVPHRCALDFAPTRTPRMFYMQQYLRSAFVVDPDGWGPASSVYPVNPATLPQMPLGIWNAYASAFEQRTLDSKFGQSPHANAVELRARGSLPKTPYVFMPLQIPHDQSIRYFSDVDMGEALDAAHALAVRTKRTLVLKAHPANPASMREFQARMQGPGVLWSDAHVHDLLASAEGVVTINSGVGFEALLANCPVVCLGRAEYDSVVHVATPETLVAQWQSAVTENADQRRERYSRFVDWFLGHYAIDLARPQASNAVLARVVADALALAERAGAVNPGAVAP